MELALYEPGLGYYSAGAHKLGAGGDFTTAPEISALFSQCMANQCVQVLKSLGGGNVLELGAGSGIMAADILLQMERAGALPNRYFVLEVSADLQHRQQALLRERIPHLVERVEWLQNLSIAFEGIIVANEVIDALPVKRFVVDKNGIKELGVGIVEDEFVWTTRAPQDSLLGEVNRFSDEIGCSFSSGYKSEVNLLLLSWIKSLEQSLHRGAMLFVDYGLPRNQFYSPDRINGTLNCFFKHHQHDNPFINIGVQDITTWVDFTSLAEAGTQAGLELSGFSTQAHFLIGAGIDRLMQSAINREDVSDTQRWQLSQQAQQLILPDGMGESFKAMAFRKNCEVELSGFGFRDLRHLL
jgi:SAM-dependent MidA family methyltransferase